eukprot:Opistho-2@79062
MSLFHGKQHHKVTITAAELQGSSKSGYLTKQGGVKSGKPSTGLLGLSHMSWKRRWFVLKGSLLFYFKSENDNELLGTIDLTNFCEVQDAEVRTKTPFCFEVISSSSSSVLLYADTKDEMLSWMSRIRKSFETDTAAPASAPAPLFSLGRSLEIELAVCKRKGQLNKQGGNVKSWKRRWFALKDDKLIYFKSFEDKKPLGIIDLHMCSSVTEAESENGVTNSFALVSPSRKFYFYADSRADMRGWIEDLEHAIPSTPGTKTPTLFSEDDELDTDDASSKRSSSRSLGRSQPSTGTSPKLQSLAGSRIASMADKTDAAGDRKSQSLPTAVLHQRLAAAKEGEIASLSPEAEANAVATLFRANSFASKMMKFYAKFVASTYLVKTLSGVMQHVLAAESMEVDPAKLKEGQSVEANQTALFGVCSDFLSAIVGARDSAPAQLREMCHHLSMEVKKRFPSSTTKAVGGFLFLRLFCPAIVLPEYFGLVAATQLPSPNARRTLILSTKVLQNLANGVEYGSKEAFMVPFNKFIVDKRQAADSYFDSFATPSGSSPLGDTADISPQQLKDATAVIQTRLAVLLLELIEDSRESSEEDLLPLIARIKELLKAGADTPRALIVGALEQDGMRVVADLCECTPITEADELSKALVTVFSFEGHVLALLKWAISHEVEQAGGAAKKARKLGKRGSLADMLGGGSSGSPSTNSVVGPSQSGSRKRGYFYKQGGTVKSWRKRWFVINQRYCRLEYYKDEKSAEGGENLGSVDLALCSSIGEGDAKTGIANSVELVTPQRVYQFKFETESERNEWLAAFRGATEKLPIRRTVRRNNNGSGGGGGGSVTSAHAAESAVIKEGYLAKQGGLHRAWRRRWFVLTKTELAYYLTEDDADPLGTILMKECASMAVAESKVNVLHSFELGTPSRVYCMYADNQAEMRDWMTAIASLMPNNGQHADERDGLVNFNSDHPVTMQGWLRKQGGIHKTWQDRWFVLKGQYLYYFKSPDINGMQGAIRLENCSVAEVSQPDVGLCFAINTRRRVYFLGARNRYDMDSWITAVESQMVFNGDLPFADDLGASSGRFGNMMSALRRQPKVAAPDCVEGSAARGYLMKRSGSSQSWKCRWFVLKDTNLFYFKNSKDTTLLGQLAVDDAELESVEDTEYGNKEVYYDKVMYLMSSDKFYGSDFPPFEAFKSSILNNCGFAIHTRRKVYYLVAPTREMAENWMQAVNDAIENSQLAVKTHVRRASEHDEDESDGNSNSHLVIADLLDTYSTSGSSRPSSPRPVSPRPGSLAARAFL